VLFRCIRGAAVKLPSSLENIQANAERGTPLKEEAKRSLREERESLNLAQKAQQIEHSDREMQQREKYAGRVFALVVGWIVVIFVLLLIQGFGGLWGHAYHPLSDKVLITLIGSTTVDIIATLILVLKYLFRTARTSPK